MVSSSTIDVLYSDTSFLNASNKSAVLLKKPVDIKRKKMTLPDKIVGSFDVVRSNAIKVSESSVHIKDVATNDLLQQALVLIRQSQARFDDIDKVKLLNSVKKQNKRNASTSYNTIQIDGFIRRVQEEETNRKIIFSKDKAQRVMQLLEYINNAVKDDTLSDIVKKTNKMTIADDDDDDLVDDPYSYHSKSSKSSKKSKDNETDDEEETRKSRKKRSSRRDSSDDEPEIKIKRKTTKDSSDDEPEIKKRDKKSSKSKSKGKSKRTISSDEDSD